jgi:DNA-binding transcriptional regulator of glucitol operon
VAWWAVTRIEAGVGDFVQRTGNDQAQVGYSVVGRSRGRVTPCTVCTVHKETRSVNFLV